MADWLTWDGGALTADVVTSYTHTATAQLTDHPVESGGVISDHSILKPPTLTIEFAQSDRPSKDDELKWSQVDADAFQESKFKPSGLFALATAAGAALNAVASAIGLGSGAGLTVYELTAKDPDKKRIQDLHDTLLDLREKTTECSFSYQGLVLTGYYVTSVSRTTKGGSGGLCRFTLELQEVKTVETAALALGGFAVPSILSAIPLVNFGKKSSADKIASEIEAHSLKSGSGILEPTW